MSSAVPWMSCRDVSCSPFLRWSSECDSEIRADSPGADESALGAGPFLSFPRSAAYAASDDATSPALFIAGPTQCPTCRRCALEAASPPGRRLPWHARGASFRRARSRTRIRAKPGARDPPWSAPPDLDAVAGLLSTSLLASLAPPLLRAWRAPGSRRPRREPSAWVEEDYALARELLVALPGGGARRGTRTAPELTAGRVGEALGERSARGRLPEGDLPTGSIRAPQRVLSAGSKPSTSNLVRSTGVGTLPTAIRRSRSIVSGSLPRGSVAHTDAESSLLRRLLPDLEWPHSPLHTRLPTQGRPGAVASTLQRARLAASARALPRGHPPHGPLHRGEPAGRGVVPSAVAFVRGGHSFLSPGQKDADLVLPVLQGARVFPPRLLYSGPRASAGSFAGLCSPGGRCHCSRPVTAGMRPRTIVRRVRRRVLGGRDLVLPGARVTSPFSVLRQRGSGSCGARPWDRVAWVSFHDPKTPAWVEGSSNFPLVSAASDAASAPRAVRMPRTIASFTRWLPERSRWSALGAVGPRPRASGLRSSPFLTTTETVSLSPTSSPCPFFVSRYAWLHRRSPRLVRGDRAGSGFPSSDCWM